MKYDDDELDFLELHQIAFDRVLLAMTAPARDRIKEKSDGNHEYVKANWVGYGLLEFAKSIRPKKSDQKQRNKLDGILGGNGLTSGFLTIQNLPSGNSAFTVENSGAIFNSLAEFKDIPLLPLYLMFLKFLEKSPQLLSIFPLSILKDGKRIDVSYDDLVTDIERHIKNCEIEFLKTQKLQKTQAPPSLQPHLTIPQPKTGNENYYANAALEVIGRKKEKELLEAFLLKCDLNIAWFQLAGVAGQGKSRLAFDLVQLVNSTEWQAANGKEWRAGFMRENDIHFFKDKWAQWQPDKSHLLVFDYVIGREHEIKPIIQSLIFRQHEFPHKIRILLIERHPWNRGAAYNIAGMQADGLSLSMGGRNRAPWFLQLCEKDDYDGEILVESSFADGVVELKSLTENGLLKIVKQLMGGNSSIPDTEILKALKRIDNSGRPLYAYLLARQINDNPENLNNWKKTDLLNGQLRRDKIRWENAFAQNAPTWGNSHSAMKLAVLATIIRKVEFDSDFIKHNFGKIDSELGNQALAIASANHNGNDDRPSEIYAMEPDLLGEWFVLLCFHKGLELNKIFDLAWQFKPNDTAEFLQRISLDFPHDQMTTALLDHPPLDKPSAKALNAILWRVMLNLSKADCLYPPRIFQNLERTAKAGGPICMLLLGCHYYAGSGEGGQSFEKAVDWFRKSAEVGIGTAIYNLGVCYFKGNGVKQNFKEAVDWFRKAVKIGDSRSMAALGWCYEAGLGVCRNHNQAAHLYEKGALLGDEIAKRKLFDLRRVIEFVHSKPNENDPADECWAESQVKNIKKGGWEFSSPFEGDWKEPVAAHAKFVLACLRCAFRSAGSLQELGNKIVRRMRLVPLVFYPGYSLVEVEFYCPDDRLKFFCSIILGQNSAFLNKENNICALNTYILDLTLSGADFDYIKFLLFCARGLSLSCISTLDDLRLNTPQYELPKKVKEGFFPLRHVAGSFERGESRQYEAFLLEKSQIYLAEFSVSSDGLLAEISERVIADNIPVLQRKYHGHFFYWC